MSTPAQNAAHLLAAVESLGFDGVRHKRVPDYQMLQDLKSSLSSIADPPLPDLVGAIARHLAQVDQANIRHGLGEVLYSALRHTDRAIVAAVLAGGVDPNWQPGNNTNFPANAVISLLTIGPPCDLDQDEVIARLRMLSAAGAHFQRLPDPTHACPGAIAWPLSFSADPSDHQLTLVDVMLALEFDAGREPVLENCLHDLVFLQTERVVGRLAPILARCSANRLSGSVAQPAVNHRSISRF